MMTFRNTLAASTLLLALLATCQTPSFAEGSTSYQFNPSALRDLLVPVMTAPVAKPVVVPTPVPAAVVKPVTPVVPVAVTPAVLKPSEPANTMADLQKQIEALKLSTQSLQQQTASLTEENKVLKVRMQQNEQLLWQKASQLDDLSLKVAKPKP
jgi:hypothetical protein